MSGNWAIGSARMATRPPRTVIVAMTIATMGRRTKNRDMGSVCCRGREWLGILHRAIGRPSTFHDDARAGLQAFVDDPAAADAVADLDGPRADLVVLADNT